MVRRSSRVKRARSDAKSKVDKRRDSAVSIGKLSSRSPTPVSTAPTSITNSPGLIRTLKRKLTELAEHEELEDAALVKIAKGEPSQRDPTEIVCVGEDANGVAKTLWMKLDTGADFNTVTENVVKQLGYESKIEPISPTSEHLIVDMCGHPLELDRKIQLSFKAGHHQKLIKNVEFYIPRSRTDTSKDGIPDILLGWKEIIRNHMLMLDIEFTNEADPFLDVIAKRADDELSEGQSKPEWIFLGKKYPQGGKVRR